VSDRLAHPTEILFGGGVALACDRNGEVHAEARQGLFAGDTRVLSTYRWAIAGHAWRLLARSRPSPSTVQWDMQNPTLRTPGAELSEGQIHLRLRRRVCGALHDEIIITSFAAAPVRVRLALQLDADFADIFQVRDGSLPPHLSVQRVVAHGGLSLVYERRDFRRALHVRFDSSADPDFVGSQIVFDLSLRPAEPWRCRVEAVPELDGRRLERVADDGEAAREPRVALRGPRLLAEPFATGCLDLDRLGVHAPDGSGYVAAGVPWFVALFGRDTLVTSLMAGLAGAWPRESALVAIGRTQSRVRDDARDAQPGKLAHELRHGELAHFHSIPHTPYYGTHDAPALFVLALWNAHRWSGDRALLARHLPTAEAALRWCEEAGDEDQDGLLEYRTRSDQGYRNQGWKDAGDAVVHADGRLAEPPIATVELQAYFYAARLAMAELLESIGEGARAQALRAAAASLRQLVEDRFWMDDEGSYALALDGNKRLVRSVASNAGHLLWCGLPEASRARRASARLFADDMFTGHGIRTLSARHPRYNPLSYQVGSVWPHDNALIAAGLARYGLHEEAARVLHGLLRVADRFEQHRLPELFCGFPEEAGGPVPYEQANVPQAWAAAVPILAAQLFAGLVPDAPRGRCYLSPRLPEWLPALVLDGIEIGGGRLSLELERVGDETRVRRAEHARLEIVVERPMAPLWGAPMT
jgi:glycogen debranching enzyme